MASPSSKLYKKQKPLREIVGDEIRARIYSGSFPPGFRLVERDLADMFEVSRLPVREAIRVLQNEGLVEPLASRGTVVKTLSRQEVSELFDIREALEVMATRQATERVDDDSSSRLRASIDESQRAIRRGDLDAAHAANASFHDQILALSGNVLLQHMLEPLIARLHWLFRQIPDFEQLCAEHDALCEAISSGDPDAAAEAARTHVLSYKQQTLEFLFG